MVRGMVIDMIDKALHTLAQLRVFLDGTVGSVFWWRPTKPHSSRVRAMALPVMEFMRRFLQHVLPWGFVKVRYYGFLSPSFGVPLGQIKARIDLVQGFARELPKPEIEQLAPMRCLHCGGVLQPQRVILPRLCTGIAGLLRNRAVQAATHALGAGP